MGPDKEFEDIKQNLRAEVYKERVFEALEIFFNAEPTEEQVLEIINRIIDQQGN